MAASIIKFCQARPPDAKALELRDPEWFVFLLNRLFGECPVELNEDHIPKLEGASAMWSDVMANPFDILIRNIRRYGAVRVWREDE